MSSEKVQQANEQKKTFPWLVIFLNVMVIAIIVLLISIFVLNSKKKNKCEGDCGNEDTETVVDASVDVATDTDTSDEQNAPMDNYIESMEKKLEQVSTNTEKADIYLEMAVELWYYDPSEENFYIDSILSYLQKSEELNPTTNSAWWLSYVNRELGNEEVANEYLRLFRERE